MDEKTLAKEHHVWETAVWICATGRKLVRRADGAYRIIPAGQVVAADRVLTNKLRPCKVAVCDDGIYTFEETQAPSNFAIYYRGDPRENEAALREALPALYLSFRSSARKSGEKP